MAVRLGSMLGLGSDIARRVLAAVEATDRLSIALDAAGADSSAVGVSSSMTGAAGA